MESSISSSYRDERLQEWTCPCSLLLTGRPGTGKTSLIKTALAKTGARVGGFYTEEIRTAGTRRGFRIVTLDGEEALLAHVDISSRFRVGRYGVDVGNLDGVAVSTLRRALRESDLVVIDEIGKMEVVSPQFREAVTQAINSGKMVLGTIMLSPHPFADQVKGHPGVRTLHVTGNNHDDVLEAIENWLTIR